MNGKVVNLYRPTINNMLINCDKSCENNSIKWT